MKKIKYIIALILFGYSLLNAQEYHIGIRGGMNFSKINGPVETGVDEIYSFTNGFHFGIEALYSFNDYFSAGTGITYSQIGSSYNYDGAGYYIFRDVDSYLLKSDNVSYSLNISNSYINLPLNIYFKPIKKIELKVGGYLGFLINPTANGKLSFGTKFNQQLKYNYYSDKKPSVYPYSSGYLKIKTFDEDGNEVIRQTRKVAKAYYQYNADDYEDETFYNLLDYGVNVAVNYYFNPSLYLGVNLQYGLADITNNKLDRSLKSIVDDGDLFFNNDDHFIYREDIDTNFNLQLSIGFRF